MSHVSSIKSRPGYTFSVPSQVCVDDKSFTVSGLSCTHVVGALSLSACQNRWDLINQSARNHTVAWQWLTINEHNIGQTAKQPSAKETSAVVFVKQIFKLIWRLNWSSSRHSDTESRCLISPAAEILSTFQERNEISRYYKIKAQRAVSLFIHLNQSFTPGWIQTGPGRRREEKVTYHIRVNDKPQLHPRTRRCCSSSFSTLK